jgi:hypothetical protein
VTIHGYIVLLTIIAWLLPPFRQYRGSYFYFFLILAVSDPLNIAFKYLLNLTFYLHFILLLLQIFSLVDSRWVKNVPLILITVLLSVGANMFLEPDAVTVLMVAGQLVVLSIFLKKAVSYLRDFGSLNLFFFALILYEASIISKYFVLLLEIPVKIIYFNLTSVFETLLAFYFTFFTVENSPKISFGAEFKKR